LLKFKNLTEIQLLILMLELENYNNKNIISFTKLQTEEAAKILNVAEITIKKCLQSLIANDFLVRVSRSNYLANPLTFYKGGTNELKNKLTSYNSVKIKQEEEKYNSLNTSNLDTNVV
jgi:predicted transcriptional regulator